MESRRRPLWVVVLLLFVAALTAAPAAPAAAQTAALDLDVDVAAFSARAEAWRQASVTHRQAALVRAEELGVAAQEQEAAVEAARRVAAAAAAAAATTTTVPPTTSPPPTAAPSPTTTAAAADEPPTTTTPSDVEVTTTTTAAPVGGPTPEQWLALRMCESGNRYDALHPSGRYRGAYQFSQATWDWVAGIAFPDLVGVDPAAAAPADQDGMALALYDLRGAGPWPHCGVHLS